MSAGSASYTRLEIKIQDKIRERTKGGPGELLKAFNHFDADRSGSIDYPEFRNVLNHFKLGVPEKVTAFLSRVEVSDLNPVLCPF